MFQDKTYIKTHNNVRSFELIKRIISYIGIAVIVLIMANCSSSGSNDSGDNPSDNTDNTDNTDNSDNNRDTTVPYEGPMYVSITGDDANDGSINSPKKTIQAAINAATTNKTIHVSAGTYTEELNLKPGIQLLGGYNDDWSDRNNTDRENALYKTAIVAPVDTVINIM